MPYLGVISSSFFSIVFYKNSESSKSCQLKMIGYFEFKSSCSYIQCYLPFGSISRRYDDQSSNQPMIQCINQPVSRSVRRASGQSISQAVSLSSVCLFVWRFVVQSARLISWLSIRLSVSHALRLSVSQSASWSVRRSVYLSVCVFNSKTSFTHFTQFALCCLSICLVRGRQRVCFSTK